MAVIYSFEFRFAFQPRSALLTKSPPVVKKGTPLCLCCPTMSDVGENIVLKLSRRPVRLSIRLVVRPVRYCYHSIS